MINFSDSNDAASLIIPLIIQGEGNPFLYVQPDVINKGKNISVPAIGYGYDLINYSTKTKQYSANTFVANDYTAATGNVWTGQTALQNILASLQKGQQASTTDMNALTAAVGTITPDQAVTLLQQALGHQLQKMIANFSNPNFNKSGTSGVDLWNAINNGAFTFNSNRTTFNGLTTSANVILPQ